MQFALPKSSNNPIKVIGVGGGGSNAVNTMFEQGIKGVDFIVCNTDAQALDVSNVPLKVQLGSTLTSGQGAGSIPEVGKNAAIENLEDLTNLLGADTKMVFVTAGMGGGTGTGAGPVIAQACRELGILTVGIVTIPFKFEGKKRSNQADSGLKNMRDSVDTLLVIRNDKLRELYGNQTLRKAFKNADQVLCIAAKGIAEVITRTGEINVDMNDVNTVMRQSGNAIMGSGMASGEGRSKYAVIAALESPLLNDNDITGAKHVLLNITVGNEEILMDEIMEITDYIQEAAGQNAEVIWGYAMDDQLEEDICITVIATGFEAHEVKTGSEQIERKSIVYNLGDDSNEVTKPVDCITPIENKETTISVLGCIVPEPEDLLEKMAPRAFSGTEKRPHSPEEIREHLNANVSLGSTHYQTSPNFENSDDRFIQVAGEQVRQILERSLDSSLHKEMSGLSDILVKTIREVVREITPEIARSIIREEIEKIKKI